jgi:hypothetical protein
MFQVRSCLRADCIYFVEIDHGENYPKTSIKFVKSHGQLETEIRGLLQDVDNICINLAGQFAAGATYLHMFERILANVKEQMKRESERKIKELEDSYEEKFTELKKQVFGSKSQPRQEGDIDDEGPDYVI